MHWLITSRSHNLGISLLILILIVSINGVQGYTIRKTDDTKDTEIPQLEELSFNTIRQNPNTIFREFDTRQPMLVESPSNYTYVTSYGNYSFDKETGAYQYRYRNGSLLAPSVKFILQHLIGEDWEDLPLSAPFFVETKEEYLQWNQRIQTSYYAGQIIVDALFYENRPPKLSVVYNKPISLNLTFRILFKVAIPQAWEYFLDENEEISIIPKSDSLSLRRNKVRVLETPNSILKLLVDWSDFGSSTVILKGSTVTVVFPNNINDIDPTVIGECSIYTNRFQFQKKLYFSTSVNRWFVWYYRDYKMRYATSIDEVNWDHYVVRNATNGDEFSLWENETHVSYGYSQSDANQPLCYRLGKHNANGTISWLTSEQTVLDATPDIRFTKPFISVDSDNFSFISYRWYNETSLESYPYVVKSKFKNGTWSHADGFPHQLSTLNSVKWSVVIIPLSSTKMYSIYHYGKIFGKLWNGTGWENQETISSSTTWDHVGWGSVADESDNIFYVGLKDLKNIIALKRTNGTGWGTEETVKQDVYANTYPVISLGNDEVFCFWSDLKHIYFKRRTDQDGWDQSAYDWIDESDTYLSDDALASCYKMKKGNIAICYWKGISPYYLTFAKIDFSASTWIFNIVNTSFDYPIENLLWNVNDEKLTFYAFGNVTIDLGSYNENPLSITDNDNFISWTKSGSNLMLTDLSGGKIVVTFKPKIPETGSFTETTEPYTTVPTVLPPPLKNVGVWIIVGGIGLFTVSAIYKKMSTPSRRGKPRGVRSPSTRKTRIRPPPTRKRRPPSKPRRSKRTGRFTKQ